MVLGVIGHALKSEHVLNWPDEVLSSEWKFVLKQLVCSILEKKSLDYQ